MSQNNSKESNCNIDSSNNQDIISQDSNNNTNSGFRDSRIVL